jgi:hypothetical protein
MTDGTLPPEVRHLIARHARSMEHVEVLVLLARTPERSWTAEDIRIELRLPETALSRRVFHDLLDAGLIGLEAGEHPRYRFDPLSVADREAVRLLTIAYNERPVTLVRAIYERPSPAQSFADAFRLKREGE